MSYRNKVCLKTLYGYLRNQGLTNRFFRKLLFLRYILLALELFRRIKIEEKLLIEVRRLSEALTIRSETLLLPPYDIIRSTKLPVALSKEVSTEDLLSIIDSPKYSISLILLVGWNLWVAPISTLNRTLWKKEKNPEDVLKLLGSWAEEIAIWLRYRKEMTVPEPIKEWILKVEPRDLKVWCEAFKRAIEQLSTVEESLIRILLRFRSRLKHHPIRSCTSCSEKLLKTLAVKLKGRRGRSLYLCSNCALDIIRGRVKVISRVMRRASKELSRERLIGEVKEALGRSLSLLPKEK